MTGSKIKKILATVSNYSGGLILIKRIRLLGKAVIFTYHRVLTTETVNRNLIQSGMYVTVDSFANHIKWMRSNFSILSLPELISRLKLNNDIGGCCALTFDDGWIDNYQNVFPIIKEYKVPITIFLVTEYIDTKKWFWTDKVAEFLYSIYSEKVNIRTFSMTLQELISSNGLYETNNVELSIDNCIESLKEKPIKQRQALFDELCVVFEKRKDKQKRCLMNWKEIREMAQSGLVDFGSHTATHQLLDQISPELAFSEIMNSKMKIEQEINKHCSLFAYPNGNYTNTVVKLLKKAGMIAAVTTQKGFLNKKHLQNMLELPRIALHEDISNTRSLFLWRAIIQ